MARVVIAAAALLPLHLILIGPLPRDRASWMAIVGLSIFNNIIPFTLIVTGQTMIASGLASVINATTPLFGVAFIAMAGLEPLVLRKVAGIGHRRRGGGDPQGRRAVRGRFAEHRNPVCVWRGSKLGLGSLWAKLKLRDTAPLSMATGQMLCSSVIMTVLAFAFERTNTTA